MREVTRQVFPAIIFIMIHHILFDLDSTLYSQSYGLEENFAERLKEYVSKYLGLPQEECEALRREALKKFGTTLEWLIFEKGFTNVDSYYVHVHPENEADSLPPDPDLRHFLMNLPCPCSVLTNSPFFHAERIINKLELNGVFRRVFSMEDFNHRGKPNASAYNKALNALCLSPNEVLFIDDIPRYVKGYIDIGGKGILLDETDSHKNYPNVKIKDIKEIIRFLN